MNSAIREARSAFNKALHFVDNSYHVTLTFILDSIAHGDAEQMQALMKKVMEDNMPKTVIDAYWSVVRVRITWLKDHCSLECPAVWAAWISTAVMRLCADANALTTNAVREVMIKDYLCKVSCAARVSISPCTLAD
jgi:hypothetical protein